MKLEEKVHLVFKAVLNYCIASREDGGPCIGRVTRKSLTLLTL